MMEVPWPRNLRTILQVDRHFWGKPGALLGMKLIELIERSNDQMDIGLEQQRGLWQSHAHATPGVGPRLEHV